jgi:hypothetical protein
MLGQQHFTNLLALCRIQVQLWQRGVLLNTVATLHNCATMRILGGWGRGAHGKQ